MVREDWQCSNDRKVFFVLCCLAVRRGAGPCTSGWSARPKANLVGRLVNRWGLLGGGEGWLYSLL